MNNGCQIASFEDLKLFYRIRYDTWDIEKSFYIRSSYYSKDEALAIFKDKFPTIEGKVICDFVILS